MDYLYYLANASLTLRVSERLQASAQHPLRHTTHLPVNFMSVIHQINGWVVRVKMSRPLETIDDGDFKAFMNELGIPCQPDVRLQMALWSLETGQSPIDVMRRYQVAVVSHGHPDCQEILAFREQFVRGLGYCPETLA